MKHLRRFNESREDIIRQSISYQHMEHISITVIEEVNYILDILNSINDSIIWRKPEIDFCKRDEYMIWVSQENGHLGPGRQFYVIIIVFSASSCNDMKILRDKLKELGYTVNVGEVKMVIDIPNSTVEHSPLQGIMESREDIISNALSPFEVTINSSEHDELEYILDLFNDMVADEHNLLNVPYRVTSVLSYQYMAWLDKDHAICIAVRPAWVIPETPTSMMDYVHKDLIESIRKFTSKLRVLGYTVDDKLLQSISVIKIYM